MVRIERGIDARDSSKTMTLEAGGNGMKECSWWVDELLTVSGEWLMLQPTFNPLYSLLKFGQRPYEGLTRVVEVMGHHHCHIVNGEAINGRRDKRPLRWNTSQVLRRVLPYMVLVSRFVLTPMLAVLYHCVESRPHKVIRMSEFVVAVL